eukprot:4903323-Pyramimonas_sp.AAC.1
MSEDPVPRPQSSVMKADMPGPMVYGWRHGAAALRLGSARKGRRGSRLTPCPDAVPWDEAQGRRPHIQRCLWLQDRNRGLWDEAFGEVQGCGPGVMSGVMALGVFRVAAMS